MRARVSVAFERGLAHEFVHYDFDGESEVEGLVAWCGLEVRSRGECRAEDGLPVYTVTCAIPRDMDHAARERILSEGVRWPDGDARGGA